MLGEVSRKGRLHGIWKKKGLDYDGCFRAGLLIAAVVTECKNAGRACSKDRRDILEDVNLHIGWYPMYNKNTFLNHVQDSKSMSEIDEEHTMLD